MLRCNRDDGAVKLIEGIISPADKSRFATMRELPDMRVVERMSVTGVKDTPSALCFSENAYREKASARNREVLCRWKPTSSGGCAHRAVTRQHVARAARQGRTHL
jgi:hypothetical protein